MGCTLRTKWITFISILAVSGIILIALGIAAPFIIQSQIKKEAVK
jgi:uncharacterized membrane protein